MKHLTSGATRIGNRRVFLANSLAATAWLTPVARVLAQQHERQPVGAPAKSIILLWLAGGPSQLETFDPHPGTKIAAGTQAIETSVKGVQLAQGLEQTADVLHEMTLIRSAVSKEGDHERATYNIKTGYRPDPSLTHPAIGAVVCHQLADDRIEIPRHVSILPGNSPARGGYLGDQYDAFQLGDPRQPLPDIKAAVDKTRLKQRLQDLSIIDQQFASGRRLDAAGLQSVNATLQQAITMMDSEQLAAFNLSQLPRAEVEPFGDTPFGRGCLVAARLIEVGVRCVEVTLGGWDSHVANHDLQTQGKQTLDPALAALVRYLKTRGLLQHTVVLCAGEFGRTPAINPAGGRDHWPHGFSIALAGGGLPAGAVIGETDPEGGKLAYADGIRVADIHASLLSRLGVHPEHELQTPIGRPIKLSEGRVVF